MPFDQPVVPRISIRLQLVPQQLEQLYCQSAIFRDGVREEEISSLICCLVGNAALARWLVKLPAPYNALALAVPLLLSAAGVAQFLWYIRAPTSFMKHRSTVKLANRLIRVATLTLLPLTARTLLPATAPAAPLDLLPNPPFPSPTPSPLLTHLLALYNLLLLSGASVLLLNALHTALPLPAHLLIQTLCTLLLLTYQAGPAAHLLRSTYLSDELRSICTLLSILFLFSQVNAHIVGITASLDHTCYQHAEELLVAFAIIYCGWVLPLYLCIRTERHRRHQFLQRIARHRFPSLTPDSFPATAPDSPHPPPPPSPLYDTPSAAAAAASIGTAPDAPSPSASPPHSLTTACTTHRPTAARPHPPTPLPPPFISDDEIHSVSDAPSPPAHPSSSPGTPDSGEVTSRLSGGNQGVEVLYDGVELPRSPVIDTVLALVLAGVTWGGVVCCRSLLLRLALPLQPV